MHYTPLHDLHTITWQVEPALTLHLPDPGKDFVICEGSSGHDQRMRGGPANFSRSFAEFMAGWLRADISFDKAEGDRLLEVATNVRFNPEHFPSMSLRTMEKKHVLAHNGTWFEAAQLQANQLSAAVGGRGTKCAVAGLVWVSDASFGGKNTTWHGV
jgi:hypothetical protein